MRTYINISEVSGYGLQLSEYQNRDLEALRKEFAPFALVCKLVEILHISHYDEKYHAESVSVLLDYKGTLLRGYKSHYNDKAYRFYLANPYNHRHTRYYKNSNEMPNKVGKPTTAKMDEWLNYLLKEDEEKKAYAQKYIDEETAFRAELAELGEAVKWYNNESQGRIVINNIAFEFSISDCSISKEVKIDTRYGLGISEFLQMADNKYRPANNQ